MDALRSEGDLNISPRRQAWALEHLDAETRNIVAEDADLFLHQSLSSPCLNALKRSSGATLTDWQGRELLDFHGNNVHQAGFGHPHILEAITRQLQELKLSPATVHLRASHRAGSRVDASCARPVEADPVCSRRHQRHRHGSETRPSGHRALQNHLNVGIVSWCLLDCISIGGEAIFRRNIGPLLPGCEHVPPPDNRHCPFRCGAACNLACADYVEYVLEREGDVAAVIAETLFAALRSFRRSTTGNAFGPRAIATEHC